MAIAGRGGWRLYLFAWLVAALVISAECLASSDSPRGPSERKATELVRADLVLKGGTLIDGTGAPARQADVAVNGGRIAAVGSFEVAAGTRIIDIKSRVVAPGFIDLHTHSDPKIGETNTRLNRNYLVQGVTTV